MFGSGHGAKRVGANRAYKDQYYKMLSTKEGKPEGMWFRKNDYVLYDFKNRHNLGTRHYAHGKHGMPRESASWQALNIGNSAALRHWDSSGYNHANGDHIDGVGSGALHQAGLNTGDSRPHRVLDGNIDLPKTIAMSSAGYSTGKTNGKHYAQPLLHGPLNAECNIPMMWNGKEYGGARGNSWAHGHHGWRVESACYTILRDEDWYKKMSGGYHT